MSDELARLAYGENISDDDDGSDYVEKPHKKKTHKKHKKHHRHHQKHDSADEEIEQLEKDVFLLQQPSIAPSEIRSKVGGAAATKGGASQITEDRKALKKRQEKELQKREADEEIEQRYNLQRERRHVRDDEAEEDSQADELEAAADAGQAKKGKKDKNPKSKKSELTDLECQEIGNAVVQLIGEMERAYLLDNEAVKKCHPAI